MSAAKHTPGEWQIYVAPALTRSMAKAELARLVDGTTDMQPGLQMVVANGLCVAVTGCGKHGAANASLIAAAPDLLDCLRNLLDTVGHMGDSGQAFERYAEAHGNARTLLSRLESQS